MSKRKSSGKGLGRPSRPIPTAPAPGPAGPPAAPSLRPAQLFLLAAAGLAAYLAWGALREGGVAGCGPGSDCDVVLSSRWSRWFGLPVSVPALLLYLALLGATVAARSPVVTTRLWAWRGLRAGAVAVVGAALWFVGLQVLVIHSYCKFCLATHACGLVAAGWLLGRAPLPRTDGVAGEAGAHPGGGREWWRAAATAAVLLAGLVLGQFVGQPGSFALAGGGGSALTETAPPIGPAATGEPAPAGATRPAARTLSVHDGRFTFNLAEVPLTGSPAAPHVLVSLFDYTCSHCREQHELLRERQEQLGDQLAIIALPMPLDAACNPLLASTGPDHVDACGYARLGMALWRTAPERFGEYEGWFFAPPRPRPLAEVREHAAALAGSVALEAALQDPWIDEWLRLGQAVFQANWDATGRSYLPQLIAGEAIAVGVIRTAAQLDQLLEQNFGIPPRATP